MAKKKPTTRRRSAPDSGNAMAKRQAEHDGSVIEDMTGFENEVASIKLRRVSLATISLMRKANSPLVTGVGISKIENVLYECALFILFHTLPLPEVVRLLQGSKEDLELAVFEFADTIPAHHVGTLFENVMALLRSQLSTQVKVEPPKGIPTVSSGNV